MTEPEIQEAAGAGLAADRLYGLLRLRAEVFVVEQACPYLDLDGRDLEPGTRHLWIEDPAGTVVAQVRILEEPDGWRIGRVVTAPAARGRRLAARLVERALASTGRPVVLDAQSHLAPWYGRFGFVVDGPEFLEDGIPHTPMRLT